SGQAGGVRGSRIRGAAPKRRRGRGGASARGFWTAWFQDAPTSRRHPATPPQGQGCRSFFLDGALERVLVLPRQVHHLRDFCLRYLVRIDAADADPATMDVQHNAGRLFARLLEKPLENMNDE